MKGSWVTALVVGGVLALLTLFIGLQYNWLTKASEAERERMQRRAETDTRNFADDFNREIQAAYFNFQIDASAWDTKNWGEFNERYDYWKSKTQYPELIKSFVYFGDSTSETLVYDPQARAFASSQPRVDLTELKARVDASRNFDPFDPEHSVLIMPVHVMERHAGSIRKRRALPEIPGMMKLKDRKGLLMIVLDREVITGRILPDLFARHFPENNFRAAVSDSTGAQVFGSPDTAAEPDAKAGLVNLAPDNLMFFASRGPISKVAASQAAVVTERIESQTVTRTETGPDGAKTGTFTIELKPGPSPDVKTRTSIFTGTERGKEPWTLSVRHTAGSIGASTRNEFNKSFFIGLGLYLLLVGAILAIVVSALRSKRFAQRQIDFVSSVSHEFRTPLAVIYSASENLADGVAHDREQVVRYGSLIKGEGRKLSSMVEQILQFAGASAGKRRYSFSSAEVGSVVAAAIAECTPVLEEGGFDVETDVPKGLPTLRADADAVSTALQNLIINSAKYSNGSRWIRVSASNGNGTIKVSVQDRGIGIAAADVKHVFEPFYRAPGVVDAQIHGNGLGLALVKQIAEAHGGKVSVKSEPGKGSTFTIELPQM